MKNRLFTLFAITALSVLGWSGTVMGASYGDTKASVSIDDDNFVTFDLNDNWRKKYPTRNNNYIQKDVDDESIEYDKYQAWGVNNLNHYKVVFNPNGGTNYAADYITVTQYCTYGWLPGEFVTCGTYEGTYIGVVRDGFHLKGWSLDAAGTQMVTEDSWVDENDTLKDGASITLYAQWEAADDEFHRNWAALVNGTVPPAGSTGTDSTEDSTSDNDKTGSSEDIGQPQKEPVITGSTITAQDNKTYAQLKKAALNQKISIKTAKNQKGKKIRITYKKVPGYSYQVMTAANKKFTKNVKIYKTSKNSYTVKKLKKKKTYYVRIRTVRTVCYGSSKKICYGRWSKAKKVRVTK